MKRGRNQTMLDQNSIDRRSYLTAVGAAGTTTLIAGCTGNGGEEDSASDDGDEGRYRPWIPTV